MLADLPARSRVCCWYLLLDRCITPITTCVFEGASSRVPFELPVNLVMTRSVSMVVCKTLFIGTFTLTWLRIRETSFLDDGHDSSGTLGPFHAVAAPLLRRKRLYICSGNLLYTQHCQRQDLRRAIAQSDQRNIDLVFVASRLAGLHRRSSKR